MLTIERDLRGFYVIKSKPAGLKITVEEPRAVDQVVRHYFRRDCAFGCPVCKQIYDEEMANKK